MVTPLGLGRSLGIPGDDPFSPPLIWRTTTAPLQAGPLRGDLGRDAWIDSGRRSNSYPILVRPLTHRRNLLNLRAARGFIKTTEPSPNTLGGGISVQSHQPQPVLSLGYRLSGARFQNADTGDIARHGGGISTDFESTASSALRAGRNSTCMASITPRLLPTGIRRFCARLREAASCRTRAYLVAPYIALVRRFALPPTVLHLFKPCRPWAPASCTVAASGFRTPRRVPALPTHTARSYGSGLLDNIPDD